MTSKAEMSGPWGWANALAWRERERSSRSIELACYTNLRMPWFDPVDAGPYTIIRPLQDLEPFGALSSLRLGLAIRIQQFIGDDDSHYYLDDDWEQNDPHLHHGGNAGQELAALTSLILGVRLREGGLVRVYHDSDGNPCGQPHAPNAPPPYAAIDPEYSLLPGHADWGNARDRPSIDISNVKLLDFYADLSGREALALVRAARSYQEAVWIADADPRQAWLRLVTAAEAVAQLAPDGPPGERLEAAFPQIAEKVARMNDPDLAEWIAVKFADQGRSTAKFLDFLVRHRPPVPKRRPAEGSRYRLDWKNLRKQLNLVYSHRSKDLHQGRPIPDVMCQPPGSTSRGIAHEVAWVDESWRGEPPMHLHVFEYLVRGALLSWWRKTASERRSTTGGKRKAMRK